MTWSQSGGPTIEIALLFSHIMYAYYVHQNLSTTAAEERQDVTSAGAINRLERNIT
jgi:hypothetical protein